MISAGLDIGAETIKVVVLADGKVRSYSIVKAGFALRENCDNAIKSALESAGLALPDVSRFAVTGIGRQEAGYDYPGVSELLADMRGATWLDPTVRTVIDVGYEEARVIRGLETGKVLNYIKNDKCAAGAGAFIETMARALEVDIEEIGILSLQASSRLSLSFTCTVFAESEVVSLIHSKVPKADIAGAIHEFTAGRITSMVRSAGLEPRLMFIGGVAKNRGVVEKLKKYLETEIVVVEEPRIVSALGAALIARDREGVPQ